MGWNAFATGAGQRFIELVLGPPPKMIEDQLTVGGIKDRLRVRIVSCEGGSNVETVPELKFVVRREPVLVNDGQNIDVLFGDQNVCLLIRVHHN